MLDQFSRAVKAQLSWKSTLITAGGWLAAAGFLLVPDVIQRHRFSAALFLIIGSGSVALALAYKRIFRPSRAPTASVRHSEADSDKREHPNGLCGDDPGDLWQTQYRLLFENTNAGVCVYAAVDDGRDFLFKDLNPAVERIERVRREDLLGRRLLDVFPAAVELGLTEVLERVWRTGMPEHLPPARYQDARISGWRENRVYRLPTGDVVAVYEDVTLRQDAARRFADQQFFFGSILQNVRDGIWFTDSDGRITFANQALTAMLGRSMDELRGALPFRQPPHGFFSAIEAFFRSACEQRASVGYELQLEALTEPPVWRSGWLIPLLNEEEFIGVIGTVQDITERKQAERVLLEKETRFRALVEQASDGFFIHDGSGRFIDVNRRACEELGYSREELLALSVWDVDAVFGQKEARGAWATLQLGESCTLVSEHKRKDGSVFPVEIHLTCCDSNGQRLFLAFTSNIAERRQSEELRALHGEMFRHMAEGVVLVNAKDHRILLTNRGADRMFDYQSGELTGQPVTLLSGPAAERGDSLFDEIAQQLDRLGEWRGEAELVRKGGMAIWCSLGVTQFEYPGHGRVWLMVHQNITEVREARIAVELHRERLTDLVEARTAELETARQDAERSARVKAEFLANMSHEIRTPLNAILGFAQLGQLENNSRSGTEIFRQIHESGQMLLGIVNDILDYSKIDAGKLILESEVLSPSELAERAAELVRTRAENKGLTFQLEKAPDLPARCYGDALRIVQILGNLLSNAIKFTEQGQIVLTAEWREDVLVFRVADTGIGMTEAAIAHLFRPFEQADGTITRKFGGTGLGLAITKQLVDLMGGRINVSSRVGAGSVFEVRLPLKPLQLAPDGRRPAEVLVAEADIPESGVRLAGLNILAAEDNEINRILLREVLEWEGCRLVLVENGLQAVDDVRNSSREPFDIVLMDIEMPDMDGYEATRLIHEMDPRLPIVGLTAHAMPESRRRCLAAGMAEHIAKPFNLNQLIEEIRAHARLVLPLEPAAAVAHAAGGQSQHAQLEGQANRVDWESAALVYGNRPDAWARVLKAVQCYAGTGGLLCRAATAADCQRLAFLAHSLNRMAGEIFAGELRQLVTDLETAARSENMDAADLALRLADTLCEFRSEAASHPLPTHRLI